MLDNQQVAENIEKARIRIAEYCKRCNRTEKPLLLAATKTVPEEQINFVIRECGITDIGENRVQELLEKYDSLDKSVRLHFIGRLQRNKVKYIIDKVCMIQSADSLPLIEEIEKQAAKRELTMDILLEVNTGREPQKGGFFPEELETVLPVIADFPHVRVKGLMAVSPVCTNKQDIYKYFEESSQKFIDISGKRLHNIAMSILSMGMSDSLEPAVLSGSTMVRLGSALFGKRSYPENNPAKQNPEQEKNKTI